MKFVTQPVAQLSGEVQVPGDKSISHRALLLGAVASGESRLRGLLMGEDNLATLHALRQLGVEIEVTDTEVIVQGVGLHSFKTPTQEIDCGNAGTGMRLLAGLLAGSNIDVVLTGDASLVKRPMQRIVDPLTQMGAVIEASCEGTAPLQIRGNANLHGIIYHSPVASAQVKSSILLAALQADGLTTVIEPALSRDHTERMLQTMGADLSCDQLSVTLTPGRVLQPLNLDIPGDISSAAFFMVAATIASQADITLTHVGLNPTRTGVIEILQQMGADIEITNQQTMGNEPVADIRVRSSQLHGINIPVELVPSAIDEFPILFIAAANAQGKTLLTNAKELRVKESDRIAAMATGLSQLGINAQATDDGIIIEGGTMQGGEIDSHGDHRIAMSFAIAGITATNPIIIHDCDNVKTSFPNFVELAQQLGIFLASA